MPMRRGAVRESLVAQLIARGGMVEHFEDMINDYMSLWDTKMKLISDIRKRGIIYEGLSSVGKMITKENTSVKTLLMVNKQMLMILHELGLTTDEAYSDDGDDL